MIWRMLGSSWRMATNRSMPMANPACGGVPYRRPSRNQPKRRSACSRVIPSTSNTLAWTSGSMDPDASGTELGAVEDQVVGEGERVGRVVGHLIDVDGAVNG
jgi:hypothetical protein